MAGAVTALRRRHLSLWSLVAVLISAVSLASGQQSRGKGDFLIVEKVDRLLVYNKYQQEATGQDRRLLVPFVPMRIRNADGTLSDGYTRCIEVEIDAEVFFLPKDKEGNLAHTGPIGLKQRYTNATVLSDSAKILTNKSCLFKPINSPALYLPSGTTILRVFRHGNSTYCHLPGNTPSYGWVEFPPKTEGRDWVVVKGTAIAESGIPSSIVERIRARLDQTNTLLAQLFKYFNEQTHQQKEVPHWELAVSSNTASCKLQGTSRTDDFRESTLYLVKDLENIVLGTGLRIAHEPGSIEVRSG